MSNLVQGLHHITALASDPQKNVDFYEGVLGLRLVKKTINYDAPDVYHLYYGDAKGSPGTILTFFPYPNIPKGRRGKGQLTRIALSISKNAVDYWLKRLSANKVIACSPETRFGETVIAFEDHDGLGLELVAHLSDSSTAIKGFFGVTLTEEAHDKTADLLVSKLDHTLHAQQENRYRFVADSGHFVDIVVCPDALQGQAGYGTVHHVAFATESRDSQLQARTNLIEHGLNVTPVLDRTYFHSIYFREPGGVLFEIATCTPGFTIDEDLEYLGESLQLPPWAEKDRQHIETYLPSIKRGSLKSPPS